MNKTDLKFGEGITTVIGPNGCGKTNIVDAIRWILGEHKNSLLRSTRMEDVIFNGTKNRKPLGFCEVSLSIHNNKGVLPVEYTDVEITRRLYRSGESEYLINKTPCRLKDIFDLFVDTGMGAHAYSVIELNMIDSILSFNPDDRRRMFEEAAGVNHYKRQRNSTFRQLESTLQDLDRVNDIISEVDDKVNHLKLQLKRFKRHKTLVENLRNSEIYYSQVQIQILNEKISPLTEKLQTLKSNYSAISGQLSLDESLIESVQNKFDTQKSLYTLVNQKVAEIDKSLRETNDNILIYTEKIKSNESRLLQYGDELKILDGRIQTLSDQLIEIKTQINHILPKLSDYDKRYKEKYEQLSNINKLLGEKSSEFQNLRNSIDATSKSLYRNEARLSQIKGSIEEKNDFIENLSNQKEVLLDQIGKLDFDLKEVFAQISTREKDNNEISLKIESINEKRLAIEEEILALKENKTNVSSQIKSEKSKHQFYTDILQRHEGQTDGAKFILSNISNYKGVIGSVTDLVDSDEKYRLAIESGLGEATNYIVVDTYKNALKIVSTIKKDHDLSIYLIPLDRIPKTKQKRKNNSKIVFADSVIICDNKFNDLFAFLLQNKIIIDNSKDIDKEFYDQYDVLTLSGDTYNRNSVIKVKSKKEGAAIGRRKQIDEIEKNIASLILREKELMSKIDQKEKTANQLREQIKIKSENLDKCIKSLQSFETKHSEIKFEQKHIKTVLDKNEEEISASKSKILALSSEYEEVHSGIEENKLIIEAKTEDYKSFEAEINKLRISQNKYQQDVQDSRVKLIEIKKELEGLEYRLKSGTDQISELETRKSYISSEQVKSDKLIQDLNIELNKALDDKQALSLLQNEKLLEKNKVETEYNRSLEELQEVQRTVRDQQKIKEKKILEIQNLEMQIAESTKEIEIIKRRIEENYHCNIPTDKLDLSDININELATSIESINRSIQRIGPINMEVKDEFETESNRLIFLQEQHKDLTESEMTLRDTIKKIDDEARNQFLQTFEEVRNNFKITYSKFFHGGEADIRLIGDDDPLESDISIIARPPGKRTQTLRMLSAGEKSLTAIALLFAIYLVKPSPFCILDEVDAPLDDANIKKFTDVLSEFSDKTQFIVVTHNKLTMEASDFLYGVTQTEDGVSKVVSVKFQKDQNSNKNSVAAI